VTNDLTPSMEEALAVVEEAGPRFVALLASATDGTRPVRGSQWTVGELAAHVVGGTVAYQDVLDGAPHPWPDLLDGPAHNAALLATVPGRDPAKAAAVVEEELPRLLEAFRRRPDTVVAFAGGVPLPATSLAALTGGEFLMHGRDLARTLRAGWEIPRAAAVTVLRGLCPLLPHVLTPKGEAYRGTFVATLRGGGPSLSMNFDGGLTVTEGAPAKPHCRISADPVAFLLNAYGRAPLWRPVVTGGMVAYGRQPWRAFAVNSLLRKP